MSPSLTISDRPELKVNTFDVIKRRKKIYVFKLGKIWVFKHLFDDKEIFKSLAEFYKEDKFRFDLKSIGERNNALKILDRNI